MSSAEPQSKKSKMVSSLEQLKQLTTIVADTGDFEGRWLGLVRGSFQKFRGPGLEKRLQEEQDKHCLNFMKVTVNRRCSFR